MESCRNRKGLGEENDGGGADNSQGKEDIKMNTMKRRWTNRRRTLFILHTDTHQNTH